MNRKVSSYLVLAIAAAMLIYVVVTYESKEVGTDIGNIAADFTAPIWNEVTEVATLSDYKGDVIVLNLWASWCPPCKDEMPDLMELHNDYNEMGISVIGVNMTKYERVPRHAEEFMEEVQVTIPTFHSLEDETYDIYRPIGLPTTYIIDRDFVIRERITGEVNYEMLEELVLPLAE